MYNDAILRNAVESFNYDVKDLNLSDIGNIVPITKRVQEVMRHFDVPSNEDVEAIKTFACNFVELARDIEGMVEAFED